MVQDEDKTRDELLAEIAALRTQVGLLLEWEGSAKKAAAEATRWDDALLRAMVDSSPFAFYVVDHTTDEVLYLNPRFCQLWGQTDLENCTAAEGLTHTDVVAAMCVQALEPAALEASFEALKSDLGEEPSEGEILMVDGRVIERWATRLGQPDEPITATHIYMFLDVTDYRQRLDQAAQKAKMAAVSQLTGGIAHDFNNLLTSIKGYATLASREAPADSLLQRDIEQVIKSANLGANLTHRLLAFSRHKPITTRALDLNRLISPMETTLRARVGGQIELKLALGPSLGKVKIDAAEFELALTELVDNAREAMTEGGKLTIETTGVILDEDYVRGHPNTRVGRYICVRVTDTGKGMSAEVRRHLFEPFFTTKGIGRGAGLGLATVYGVVEQHRGHIDVKSAPGQGTVVSLYFPRVKLDTAEWPLNQGV